MILYFLILIPSTRNQYLKLYNFAGDYIYATSELSQKNNDICDKMAIQLAIGSIKITILEYIALLLACIFPLYKIFVKNEKELILPVILPFNDPETERGFFMNFISQIVACAYGVTIIPGSEMMTCVLKNNVSVAAAIIENSLHEFGDHLIDIDFPRECNWQLRNILVKIMDYNRFVGSQLSNSFQQKLKVNSCRLVVDITKLYYWKFFLQPGLLMYSVVMGIFLYMTVSFSRN